MDEDHTRRSADEYVQRGEVFYDLDRIPEAGEEADAALAVDAFHPGANALAGTIALSEGDADKALTLASTALGMDPFHPRAAQVRAYALADLGRKDEARQAAASLLEIDRGSWSANVHYALIMRRAGAPQEALDAAWDAVRLAPDETRTHLALASIAESLDLDDLARRARQAARDLDAETVTPATVRREEEKARKASSVLNRRPNPHTPVYRYGTPRLESFLLGTAGVFGFVTLIGFTMPPAGRALFAGIALACAIGWYFAKRRRSELPPAAVGR
ncbi:tetratricopeptide repeat protein [Salininema proteolyticum]|uniref:Tetratricopeptide repeat protein n=1 Tax=Salininema proteolyticum TaxID=1607685 RepID=A0ABV8U3E4_9ACTN